MTQWEKLFEMEIVEAYCPKRSDAKKVLWIFACDNECRDIRAEDVKLGWVVSCVTSTKHKKQLEKTVFSDKKIESVDFV